MDDSCAVCADTLEWVAYGACGHRDVCSTCVVRLRFICGDRRCCICKTESTVIFITKALGDYTRMINDFSVLPSEPREGRVGSYWYHENSQAFFDDVEHYRMIKAMCRLSCSVCDKMEEAVANDGPKRRARFRNIEQLKGHLFHQHKLLMCSLCLEGRKVFICEQKLYTRAQLNQHTRTGDSEVDGSESERGGFAGHPMCEFCKTPFYGDNELYSHMSTEHYTCHICQRQHPGQYEYYKNYDDLEIHFCREHFLCEDEACLAKKFIVFQTEAEMKRHNTMEHGGRMSRAQRNAALQIPTSFRYRRSSEQDHRRGRGRSFQRDQYDNQLSIAIQASLESSHSVGAPHDSSSSSSSVQAVPDQGGADDIDPLVPPFESLTTTDSEMPSRYLQALGQSSRSSTPLEKSSFPPLLNNSNTQQSRQELEGIPNNTMAAHLRRQTRNPTILNSPQPWPAPRSGNASGSSVQYRPNVSPSPGVSQNPAGGPLLSGYASSVQLQTQTRPLAHGNLSAASPVNLGNSNRMTHSASAPNLSDSGSSKPSISDFPPVSAAQTRKMPPSNQALLKMDDVHTANKSLVEKIRAALDHDEDKYASFKDISAQYRQGSVDTEKYLHLVREYGLSHLVLQLARLCPDSRKQKELVDSYNASLRSNDLQENGLASVSNYMKDGTSVKKGKRIDEGSSSKDRLADNILSTVRTLQSNQKSPNEDVEVLSKDGYRGAKGKAHEMVDDRGVDLRSPNDSVSAGNESNQNVRDGGGGNKQRRKTSKFYRVRLGDGSMAALLDPRNSEPDPDPDPKPVDANSDGSSNPAGGLQVRGVWRKGGGHKLFS